tara:strand:+ start:2986 stop:3996 length:1011 start_codon:yes stop_codon:yes gene_type:complete
VIKNYKIIFLLILSLTGEVLFAGETCLSKLRSRNLDYEYNIPTNLRKENLEAELAVDNEFKPYKFRLGGVNSFYLRLSEDNEFKDIILQNDYQFPNEMSTPFAKTEVTLAIGKEEYRCKNISDFGNYGIEASRICGPYTLKQSTLPSSLKGYTGFWNFSLNRITKISEIKIKENGYILLTSTEGEIYEPKGIVSEEVKKINRVGIFYDFPLVSEYPNYLKGKTSLTKRIKLKQLRGSYGSGYFDFYNHCSENYGSISSFRFRLLAIPIKNNYMNYLQKAQEDYTKLIRNCDNFCREKVYQQVANSHKLFLTQKDIIPVSLRFDYIVVPSNQIDLNF